MSLKMSDNSLEKVENFCKINGYEVPSFDIQEDGGQYLATIIVRTGDGSPLEESAFGSSQSEAKSEAIKYFVDNKMSNNKSSNQMLAQNSAQNKPMFDTQVSSTSVHSSEIIDDDISQLPNSIGYLNEICQKKSYAFPSHQIDLKCGQTAARLHICRTSGVWLRQRVLLCL